MNNLKRAIGQMELVDGKNNQEDMRRAYLAIAYASIAVAEQNNHSLLKTVGRLISEDMHNSSMRPCATCKTLSGIVGEPVGCYHYQKIREEREDAKS